MVNVTLWRCVDSSLVHHSFPLQQLKLSSSSYRFHPPCSFMFFFLHFLHFLFLGQLLSAFLMCPNPYSFQLVNPSGSYRAIQVIHWKSHGFKTIQVFARFACLSLIVCAFQFSMPWKTQIFDKAAHSYSNPLFEAWLLLPTSFCSYHFKRGSVLPDPFLVRLFLDLLYWAPQSGHFIFTTCLNTREEFQWAPIKP